MECAVINATVRKTFPGPKPIRSVLPLTVRFRSAYTSSRTSTATQESFEIMIRIQCNSLRTPLYLVAVALVVAACSTASCLTAQAQNGAASSPGFGPNVIVFDPGMSTGEIQSTVNAIASQQVSDQFGTHRYALLFKPGVYGSAADPLVFQVGYYTDVAGLGSNPGDVIINGHVDVYNQCFGAGNCIALDNFWRSLSNLTIHVMGSSGCHASAEFWAVSQASPMRRVNITGGNLSLMDYCSGPSFASGGFIADSQTGFVINGSQQQFYVRNSDIGGWSNGVWNQVFSGVAGAPAQSYPNPTYTTLAATPVSREKPYLYVDANGNYNVFSPGVRTKSAGASWTSSAPGRSLPIGRFFIANPDTSVQEINEQLSRGMNLILTPGIYKYGAAIRVKRPDTVVLGLGLATLVPQSGTPGLTVADVDGVQVAGLIIDAGPVNSPVLFEIGRSGGSASLQNPLPRNSFPSHAADPISVNDVYFRIGGATPGTATTSLQVDSNNVILDDIWAWRADHGAGVGWTQNIGDHGVVINGDSVTALGLAVEHYEKEQVLWNGNTGETIFYQSELPYDPPSQSAWMDGSANGYPSYVVANSAATHQAYGLGIYSYFNQGVNIVEDNAMTVPSGPGIAIQDAGTVWLNGSGQITHVIDGVGKTVNSTYRDTVSPVVLYP